MSIKTAEFVSPRHPDKICDFIADSILDEYLKLDPESRCALEVMGGHKLIVINGEVTSSSVPNVEELVKKIVGKDYKVLVNLVKLIGREARGAFFDFVDILGLKK